MIAHWLMLVSLAMASPAHAQGQHYCAMYPGNVAPEDCSFMSLEMCQQSINGLGGYCAVQTDAPPMPPAPLFRLFPEPAQPAAVPPPPLSNAATSPVMLPDAPQSWPAPPPSPAAAAQPSALPRAPCNPLIDGTYCASAGGAR